MATARSGIDDVRESSAGAVPRQSSRRGPSSLWLASCTRTLDFSPALASLPSYDCLRVSYEQSL
jgi:hypothetical protein